MTWHVDVIWSGRRGSWRGQSPKKETRGIFID